MHQLLEYLGAGALVELSIHIAHGAVLVAAGAVFGVLALTAKGPLGVLRVCGRRLHGVLDVIVSLALALSPLVPALRPGAAGIVVVEVSAVAWLRMATLTRYAEPAVARTGAAGGVGGASGGAPAASVAGRRLHAGARAAGDVTGRLWRGWRGAWRSDRPAP
ncbi:MAG: hypothetical protein ACYDB3_04895 [Acidimicrobiales bacterium]